MDFGPEYDKLREYEIMMMRRIAEAIELHTKMQVTSSGDLLLWIPEAEFKSNANGLPDLILKYPVYPLIIDGFGDL